jgi:uncharacterized membrane protein YukC
MKKYSKFNRSRANRLINDLEHIKAALSNMGLYQSYNKLDEAVKYIRNESLIATRELERAKRNAIK